MPLLRSEELVRASLRLEHSRLHQLPKVLHEVWWVSLLYCIYSMYFRSIKGNICMYIFDQFHQYIKSHMFEMVLSFVNMYIMGSSQSLFCAAVTVELARLIMTLLISSFVHCSVYSLIDCKWIQDDIWSRTMCGLSFRAMRIFVQNKRPHIQVCWWEESNCARLWHLWGWWVYTGRQVKHP